MNEHDFDAIPLPPRRLSRLQKIGLAALAAVAVPLALFLGYRTVWWPAELRALRGVRLTLHSLHPVEYSMERRSPIFEQALNPDAPPPAVFEGYRILERPSSKERTPRRCSALCATASPGATCPWPSASSRATG